MSKFSKLLSVSIFLLYPLSLKAMELNLINEGGARPNVTVRLEVRGNDVNNSAVFDQHWTVPELVPHQTYTIPSLDFSHVPDNISAAHIIAHVSFGGTHINLEGQSVFSVDKQDFNAITVKFNADTSHVEVFPTVDAVGLHPVNPGVKY